MCIRDRGNSDDDTFTNNGVILRANHVTVDEVSNSDNYNNDSVVAAGKGREIERFEEKWKQQDKEWKERWDNTWKEREKQDSEWDESRLDPWRRNEELKRIRDNLRESSKGGI